MKSRGNTVPYYGIGFILLILASLFSGKICHGETFSDGKRNPKISSEYDVIVVGGDAEGVAAAIGAARSGSKVLLIDTRPVPGGLLTHGWLNTWDMSIGPDGTPLNGGIFGEIYGRMEGTAFDLGEMVKVLQELINNESRLDVIYGADTVLPLIGTTTYNLVQPGQTLQSKSPAVGSDAVSTYSPPIEGNASATSIFGVCVRFPDEASCTIGAKRLIDATQDADFACGAGASSTRYGEDIWGEPRSMAVTLVFRLGGISDSDWAELRRAARSEGNEAVSGASIRSAWGFGKIMKNYRPASERIGVRALNIGRQNDGSVLINALHVFGCNGLDGSSRLEARRIAESELPMLVQFLKTSIPGFGNIRFDGAAPELYVRTTRNIVSLYTLTVDDLLENRDFPDRIAYGSYPLDIQATDPGFPGEIVGKPERYAVPLRSLVPAGISNLLVVGRSAGFSSLAQSSARTVPIGIAVGQGAGISATVSITHNVGFDGLVSNERFIAEIHGIMKKQGIKIEPVSSNPPKEKSHWAYSGLAYFRRHGLASGGYENSYNLDKQMPSMALINRLVRLQKQYKKVDSRKLYKEFPENFSLKLGDACRIISAADGPGKSSGDAFEQLSQGGIFAPPWPAELKSPDSPLSYGGGYLLLQRFFSGFRLSP